MRYIQEYRDAELAQRLLTRIHELATSYDDEIVLMEVCGTHTMAIARTGLRKVLPENIRLLSGPGCPVCVTPNHYLDRAIAYSRLQDVIVATFGDMVKVPGSYYSLEKVRSQGANVVVVYSAMDALKLAQQVPDKKVVFLGIGFETTAPTVGVTIKLAYEQGVKNFFVYCGHKLIPPAMEVLIQDPDLRINGFICPGHVSTIIGSQPYEFIANKYGIPCVVAGFEPLDILQSIYMLVKQLVDNTPTVEIQYKRAVKPMGNQKALQLMREVFDVTDTEWRGLGVIPKSGLKLSDRFAELDAESSIPVEVPPPKEHPGCICGAILRGVKTPLDCKLFRTVCKPSNPIGPCMVSSEGTCAAYYKYGG